MTKLRVASLFAGIGGICLGFKQAGYELVWANEIDHNACRTYKANFGDTYLVEGDIKKVETNSIPDFDVLVAGFPCQAFSVAGYRKGFDDDRGNLFFQIVRILEDRKPQVVFLENVKNLQTHDNGNTYKVIKSELQRLGYHVIEQVLNSMKYGNVPQNRERIYIVAFLDENAKNSFRFPDELKLKTKIKDIFIPSEQKDAKYYYNKTRYYEKFSAAMTDTNSVYQWRRVYIRQNKSHVCPTLTANMGTGGHNVPIIIDDFGIRKLTPAECLLFQGFPRYFKFPKTLNDSSKYKQAGNSVTVPVIRRIAQRIRTVIEKD